MNKHDENQVEQKEYTPTPQSADDAARRRLLDVASQQLSQRALWLAKTADAGNGNTLGACRYCAHAWWQASFQNGHAIPNPNTKKGWMMTEYARISCICEKNQKEVAHLCTAIYGGGGGNYRCDPAGVPLTEGGAVITYNPEYLDTTDQETEHENILFAFAPILTKEGAIYKNIGDCAKFEPAGIVAQAEEPEQENQTNITVPETVASAEPAKVNAESAKKGYGPDGTWSKARWIYHEDERLYTEALEAMASGDFGPLEAYEKWKAEVAAEAKKEASQEPQTVEDVKKLGMWEKATAVIGAGEVARNKLIEILERAKQVEQQNKPTAYQKAKARNINTPTNVAMRS